MTPVATPVALRASTWDAALEETLSGGSDAPSSSDAPFSSEGAVHSVHARVVNVRRGEMLIALAHESLDDAPWTIRIAEQDWSTVATARVGDPVALGTGVLVLRSGRQEVRVGLAPTDARVLRPCTDIPSDDSLRLAVAALDGVPSPAAATPFGALAADALAAGIQRLRAGARSLVAADAPDAADVVAAAAQRLLGLGEGLTPSGDDVLAGLAFASAHPGLGLTALLAPLGVAAASADQRTTLLSAVTLRAALSGRARRRMHDLLDALIAGEEAAVRIAVGRTAEIGHTSGFDILTGIRIALELALGTRTRGDGTARSTTLKQLSPKKETTR